MKLAILAAILIHSANATTTGAVTFTVLDAEGYMKSVARSCLSTPDSKVELLRDNQLLVTDANEDCALEIRQFSDHWKAPLSRTVSVYAKPENKAAITKKLADKFGKSFLIYSSSACPCLLLRGPRAEEAVEFARR